MAIFFFRAEDYVGVLRDFIDETRARLKAGSVIRNPFVNSWFKVKKLGDERVLCAVSMKLIYPNIAGSAIFFIVAMAFFTVAGWKIPAVISACLAGLVLGASFFWSATFLFWAFRKGLRKKGYKGTIKRLSAVEYVRLLYGAE